MWRISAVAIVALGLVSCGKTPPTRAKITQFKADPGFLPAGMGGRLCYGVENATRLDIAPAVEKLLPASERCMDIAPVKTTTYTLTAYGPDGTPAKKSLEVKVGAPQPRVSDLEARPRSVRKGRAVQVCFKVEHANSVSAKPGKLDRRTNCLTDYPRKNTTYTVVAKGGDNEQDSGTVTVSVLR
ncbi:MAG: hypothetical protein M3N93_14035 [Acidobacteriota bacterium]|nr:hypothetical protein [Acidobacteriota bacterium]